MFNGCRSIPMFTNVSLLFRLANHPRRVQHYFLGAMFSVLFLPMVLIAFSQWAQAQYNPVQRMSEVFEVDHFAGFVYADTHKTALTTSTVSACSGSDSFSSALTNRYGYFTLSPANTGGPLACVVISAPGFFPKTVRLRLRPGAPLVHVFLIKVPATSN